jgi:hypothetical protein
MDLSEVKQAMRTQQTVNGRYYVSGVMLRYDTKTEQFYYQAELHEKDVNSLVIAKLEDVKGDKKDESS